MWCELGFILEDPLRRDLSTASVKVNMQTHPALSLQKIKNSCPRLCRSVAAASPVQGSEAHEALQVGPRLHVPLAHRVQLEAGPGQHLEIWQDGAQSIWNKRKKSLRGEKQWSNPKTQNEQLTVVLRLIWIRFKALKCNSIERTIRVLAWYCFI